MKIYIDKSKIIKAVLCKEYTKAWLLKCDGDTVIMPKSMVNFDPVNDELEAPIWLLKKHNIN